MNSIFTIILLIIIISCLVYLIINYNNDDNNNNNNNNNKNEYFLDNKICLDKINLALTTAKQKFNKKYKYNILGGGNYFRNLDNSSKAQLEIIELIEIFRPISSHSAILFHNMLDCYKQYTKKILSNYLIGKLTPLVLQPMFKQIDDINNLKNTNQLTKSNIDIIKSDLETNIFGRMADIGDIISNLSDIHIQLEHFKIRYEQIYNLIKGGKGTKINKFNWSYLKQNYIDDLSQIYIIIDYEHTIKDDSNTANMTEDKLKKIQEKQFEDALKQYSATSLTLKPIVNILDGYKNKLKNIFVDIYLKPILDMLKSIGLQTKNDSKLKFIEINKFNKLIDGINDVISNVDGAQEIIENYNNDIVNYMEHNKK